MTKQLTRNWANFHIVAIGIFYLVSGVWKYLSGAITKGHKPLRRGEGVYYG